MKPVYVVAVAFFIVCIVVFAFVPLPTITDSLSVAGALLAFLATLFTYLKVRASKKEGTVWLLLCVGFLFWLGGEILWLVLEEMTGEPPFPSMADVSWIVAYPLLIGALYLEYRRLKVDIGVKKVAVLLAVVVVGAVLGWKLLYPIVVSDISSVEKLLDLAYPLGDLAMLSIGLLVTLVYLGGRLGRAWLVISFGFILYAIADMAFSYLTWLEVYKSGSPTDLLWMAADTIVFVGAMLYRHAYEELLEE